jgi:bifunctional non-homologous end joining protein LigD
VHKWSTPARTRHLIGFIEPMIPSAVANAPSGDAWLHEVKHDGFRLIVWKAGNRVRLFTRRGFDWSHRYPRIMAAAKRVDRTFVIDGEAVVADDRGVADFDMLHSREHDDEVVLWAFDLLQLRGDDLRALPLERRKKELAVLLKPSTHDGIALSEHLDGNGGAAFTRACKMGLEGIVSKRLDSRYVSGRTKAWLKTKNPNAPGVTRFQERDNS